VPLPLSCSSAIQVLMQNPSSTSSPPAPRILDRPADDDFGAGRVNAYSSLKLLTNQLSAKRSE